MLVAGAVSVVGDRPCAILASLVETHATNEPMASSTFLRVGSSSSVTETESGGGCIFLFPLVFGSLAFGDLSFLDLGGMMHAVRAQVCCTDNVN